MPHLRYLLTRGVTLIQIQGSYRKQENALWHVPNDELFPQEIVSKLDIRLIVGLLDEEHSPMLLLDRI